MELLPDKLNHYIYFFESGKMVEKMPALESLPVVIRVSAKYPPSEQAAKYYELAKGRATELNFTLELELLNEDDA